MNKTERVTPNGSKNMIRGVEGFFEVIVLSFIYYLVWRHGYDEVKFPQYLGMGKYILMGVYGILLSIMFNSFDAFQFGHQRLTDIIIAQWISLFLVNVITYFQLCLIANVMIPVWQMFVLWAIQLVVAFILPFIYSLIYHRIYSAHRMIMVYGNESAAVLKLKMESRPDKYRVKELISVERGLEAVCQEISKFDSVIINDVPATVRNDILKFCYSHHIRTYVTPKLSDIIVRGGTQICLFDTPLLLVKGMGLTFVQRILKRAMDILICLLAMIIALPVMLVIALAIKLDDGGPVFYKQQRVTLNGKVFNILKFRSMIVNAEAAGKSIPATDNDPRITRVGRIIRATRVDELPQILNILKGDMSIVGPRPERVEHVEQYTREIPEFDFRLKVKGGLTGYAQIYGKYNTSAYDKLRLDLMYIENYSILLDIKLILMTIRILFKKESTEGFDKVLSAQSVLTDSEPGENEDVSALK